MRLNLGDTEIMISLLYVIISFLGVSQGSKALGLLLSSPQYSA